MQKYSFALQNSFLMPVLDNGHSKVVHLSFPKGKVLERHKAPSDLLVLLLTGEMEFTAEDKTLPLQQGVEIQKQKLHEGIQQTVSFPESLL